MKSEELMIGDWILHDGEPYQIRQLGIYGENRDGEDYPAVCIGKPKGIGLIIERNEIAPILLTSEILQKNGFKESKYGEMILDEELGISEIYLVLEESHDGEYYWWTINNEIIAKIKSVHELQHVLRLCGFNKKIEV